jgi:hypothetical protein
VIKSLAPVLTAERHPALRHRRGGGPIAGGGRGGGPLLERVRARLGTSGCRRRTASRAAGPLGRRPDRLRGVPFSGRGMGLSLPRRRARLALDELAPAERLGPGALQLETATGQPAYEPETATCEACTFDLTHITLTHDPKSRRVRQPRNAKERILASGEDQGRSEPKNRLICPENHSASQATLSSVTPGATAPSG